MTAVTMRIALRWRDMDMLGHLNQAVYHELLEESRGALVATLPSSEHFEFVLARVELDYRHEVDHRQREVDAHDGDRQVAVGREVRDVRREPELAEGLDVVLEGLAALGARDQRHVDALRELLLRAALGLRDRLEPG